MPYICITAVETRSSGEENYATAIIFEPGDVLDETQFAPGDITELLAVGAIVLAPGS
jgi:hypothetical protein